MDTNKNRKADAYFTLEASYIIPIAIIVFMIIIYFTFYLYNHCVVSQSVYLAALRGQQLKNVSNSAVQGYINEQLDELLGEQVFQYQKQYSSSVSLLNITVKAESGIDNKLTGFGYYKEHRLQSKGEKTLVRFNPAEVIRICH